jgi:hypothetical protein
MKTIAAVATDEDDCIIKPVVVGAGGRGRGRSLRFDMRTFCSFLTAFAARLYIRMMLDN